MAYKGLPCVCAAGRGEQNTKNVPCELRDGYKGRVALKAALDTAGRWMVQWREADGREWVGTYRLLPC